MECGSIFYYLLLIQSILAFGPGAHAVSRISNSSGNWNNPSTWSPSGIISSNDDITIASGHTITLNADAQVKNFTVSTGGKLLGIPEINLNINGTITVNGTVDMNESNIRLVNNNSSFSLGPQSVFIWFPGNNASEGASLFINGNENFHASSKLIIRNWYDYTVPLGDVVTGNFGSLELNSPGNMSSIVEWNQDNSFENHKVTGTLTIDQGWITLDKSGSITSTSIGNILLKSINSTFIAHHGTHPSSFSLTTSAITNNGGKFYGLNDGNGTINLRVTGSVTNTGNIKIINNTGVTGVSNGNAVIRIDGDFNQSSGDSRFIYNITTTNSGTFNATIKNLVLSGGIFMGQCAIHSGGQLNVLNILQDLSVNFAHASDKFRGNGLTSIGSSVNNSGFALNVGRNLSISGNELSEFTSSASKGDELVSVQKDLTITGCNVNFNYGTSDGSHASELFVHGNMYMHGGTCYLSRNNGELKSIIDNNLSISNGTLSIKGNTGKAKLTVTGDYLQSGGSMLIHANPAVSTPDVTEMEISGLFKHSGGIINFDDNTQGAVQKITIKGDSCIFEGNGILTHAGAGNSVVTGLLSFEKIGQIKYISSGTDYQIEQVKLQINNQSDLMLTGNNLKLPSHPNESVLALQVLPGGKLSFNNYSVYSNGIYNSCNIAADSSGTLSLTNEKGLFGNTKSAIMQGVKFNLHRESIVEYCGEKSQVITGLSQLSDLPEHKYGILKINLRSIKYTASFVENVYVRHRVLLAEGKVRLNNHTLTVENGNSDAFMRTNGLIESGTEHASENEKICWKNMTTGMHEFPFGRSQTQYLPVKFNLVEGAGNDVTISTRKTFSNNLPLPPLTRALSADAAFSEHKAIDRWWTISTAQGVKGDLTLTYCGDENTLASEYARERLFALQWNGTSWTKLSSLGTGVTKKTGSVTIANTSKYSHYVLAADDGYQPFALKSFNVAKKENAVLLDWETMNEASSASFTIEKSTNGVAFYELAVTQKNSSASNSSMYNFEDKELPASRSYYRIKLMDNNGIISYSETKSVTATTISGVNNPVKINSVSPNPFISSVKVYFNSSNENTQLEVIDLNGKLVYKRQIESHEAENGFVTMDLEFIKRGVYFLNIISDGKKDTRKIIKND
jgi:hypothetical protein